MHTLIEQLSSQFETMYQWKALFSVKLSLWHNTIHIIEAHIVKLSMDKRNTVRLHSLGLLTQFKVCNRSGSNKIKDISCADNVKCASLSATFKHILSTAN